MMVSLGPRLLSVELESAGEGAELAETLGTLAENAKSREVILSAFYGNPRGGRARCTSG
jgi:hypothetical protein